MSEEYPDGLARPVPNYGAMNWQDFQKLANELLFLLSVRDPAKYKCDTFLPAIREGRDRGCDGFHIGLMETTDTDRDGRWNVQVKRYKRYEDFDLTEAITKTKTMPELTVRDPNGLLIVIACPVPPEIQQNWENQIRDSGLKPAAIWDKDKLDLLIKNYAPDIMFGPGRVFDPVSRWCPHSFLMENKEDFFKEPLIGRTTEIEKLKEFSEAANPQKLAVVVGTEGAGKTHIVYEWAEKHCDDNLTREDRGNTSPVWPVAIARTWGTSLAGHMDELDPTGRQLIIADCRLNEEEWFELERSLHADARGKKVKLIAVVSERELSFIKQTFSSWGDPVEIRVDKLKESQFNDLARGKGVKDEYLHTVARVTNRIPGFLNLVLESGFPLYKLSRHNYFSAALNRIVKTIGPSEQERKATIAALAWACLTQPIIEQKQDRPPRPPEILIDYIGDKFSWTKAWRWLQKHGILKKESVNYQIGWRIFPNQLGQAATDELFLSFDDDDRFKLLVQAKQAAPKFAIGNIVLACVALSDDSSIKKLLEDFIDMYFNAITQTPASNQQFEIKLIHPIAKIYPEKIVDLSKRLLREWQHHRDEYSSFGEMSVEDTLTSQKTPLHFLVDNLLPPLETTGMRAKYTSRVLRMLPELEKLGEFSRYETNEDNHPILRMIKNLSHPSDDKECPPRMTAANTVLKEWAKSPDRMERKFVATGFAAMTALSWDTTYTVTSRQVVLGTKSITQEPEWLKPIREEAFYSLIDLIISDLVELDERESLMNKELWNAHGNLLGLWGRETSLPAREDLVQDMCDRFIEVMDSVTDDPMHNAKKVQIIKYLSSKLERDWIRPDAKKQEVKDAIVRHMQKDDMKMFALLHGDDMVVVRDNEELTNFREIQWEESREALKSQIDHFVKGILSSQGINTASISKQILLRLEVINKYRNFNVNLFMVGESLAEQFTGQTTVLMDTLLESASPDNMLLPELIAGMLVFQWLNSTEQSNALPFIEGCQENEKQQRGIALLRAVSRMDIAKALPDNFYEAVCIAFDYAPPQETARLAPFILCILDRFGFDRQLLADKMKSLIEDLPEETQRLFFQLVKFDMRKCAGLVSLIKNDIVERLKYEKMSNDLLQMLSFLFREDISGLLDFFKARLLYAISLGKDSKGYDPFPTSERLIEAVLKSDKYKPEDINKAPETIRDWVLMSPEYVGYLGGSSLFLWVDGLQTERDTVSGLGKETAAALAEWFSGDLGKYVLSNGEEVIGIKRWGIPLLLRNFIFDERLWTFLFPLTEQVHKPDRTDEGRRPWQQRLWSELMAAEGTTGIFTPTMERELAREALYRKMESNAPDDAKPFFAELVEDAKIDIERESLDEDD